MKRIFKEYLPKVEPLPLDKGSREYRTELEKKIEISDVEALCSLR